MAPETITINGVNLKNLANNVQDLAGLLKGAPRRGANVQLPGRNGSVRVPRKLHGEAEFVLPIGVKGLNPTTGLITGGLTTLDEFRKNADTLTQLLHAETLLIAHTWPDGQVRQCVAELAEEPLDFTREFSHPQYGTIIAAVRVPDAFWSATTTTTAGPFSLTTGATQALTAFQDATAPMDELTITIGPSTNPSLDQPSSGLFVAYDAVISAGRELVIDTTNWILGYGAGTSWTPDWTKVRFGPTARLFSLTPNSVPVTDPVIRLTHTGGGSATVKIVGTKKYWVG